MSDTDLAVIEPELEPFDAPVGLWPVQTEPPRLTRLRRWAGRLIRRTGRALASATDWVFGAVALTIGLAVLTSVPVAQFLCFGYLLECGGRVSRSGRLRDAFVGVRKASRLGSLIIGGFLCLLPLQIVSSLATSAELIDPGGPIARRWRVLVVLLTAVAVLHVVGATARGGRIRHFLMPFGNPFWLYRRWRAGGSYAAARDAVGDFVASLRLPYYLRIGLLGFVGTFVWLAIPVSLLAMGRRFPPIGILGAVLIGMVAMPLPFLQARYASERRFRSLFELRSVRQRFMRAPWAFAFGLFLTLVFAVPLYLLKIEIIPRETLWLPGVVFLAFIMPARVATAWAYGRSARRDPPRHWFFRWTGRLAILPVAVFYVIIVFLSQYTAWRGVWNLYEQHAFLIPAPFLGL